MAKTPKIDPDRMYVCRATCALPNGATIHVGERRCGGDPLVQGWPDWWADELTTSPERLRAEEAEKFERALRADRAGRPRSGGEQREVYVCVKQLTNPATGYEVGLGERFLDSHPLVAANPGNFKPIGEVFPEAAAS